MHAFALTFLEQWECRQINASSVSFTPRFSNRNYDTHDGLSLSLNERRSPPQRLGQAKEKVRFESHEMLHIDGEDKLFTRRVVEK